MKGTAVYLKRCLAIFEIDFKFTGNVEDNNHNRYNRTGKNYTDD